MRKANTINENYSHAETQKHTTNQRLGVVIVEFLLFFFKSIWIFFLE